MAWDGTLTPPPIHNEKAKKRKWVDNVPKQTHFHILLLFFIRYILEVLE